MEDNGFKLVYEDAGDVKGSYTGRPSEKDVSLIEREVLEGKKPIGPKPEPTPEPEHKVDNEASMAALKEMLEAIAANQDDLREGEFEFDHCDASLFKGMWESMDLEIVRQVVGLINGDQYEFGLRIKHEGVMLSRDNVLSQTLSLYH